MTAISNWYLYIGMFLVATGFGLAIGAVFIVYWAVKYLADKQCGSQVNYGTAEFTQNNYYMNGTAEGNLMEWVFAMQLEHQKRKEVDGRIDWGIIMTLDHSNLEELV